MRKHIVATCIAACLFIIPFFWMKSGYMDLGGDSGRLYFLNPAATFEYFSSQHNPYGASIYAMVPYYGWIFLLSRIFHSPTALIAFENGLKLSISFLSIYFIIRTILLEYRKKAAGYVTAISIATGTVYVGFITKNGWPVALDTHNQVFLNPLIFYLLLRFVLTGHFVFGVGILVLSLLYSANFGFSAAPQILSFYPFSIIYLYVFIRFILRKPFAWKKVILLFIAYVGIHAFHLVPTIASLLERQVPIFSNIFSSAYRQAAGVSYFDLNRQDLGKLSIELFQPVKWNSQTLFTLLVPLVAFFGFLKKPSKLTALTATFFALTFYLVSANITILGVKLYRKLFSLPGFIMFRSFDDKWYYVFIFFYVILFGLSLTLLLQEKSRLKAGIILSAVLLSIGVRIFPFIGGEVYKAPLYQSKNVAPVFDIDPDLLATLSFVKRLPNDGRFLTAPLTLPYFQVIYGKHEGAYMGVSMVRIIGGKEDYPGFGSFGQHGPFVVQALKENNVTHLTQLLSLRGVRYVFYNSDDRVLDKFPKFPYYRFDMTEDIPVIDSQKSYSKLLQSLPAQSLYKRGFFEVFRLDDSVVRSSIYIPDRLYASDVEALDGASYKSAYADQIICEKLGDEGVTCDGSVNKNKPNVTFETVSPQTYNMSFEIDNNAEPFILVLSRDFHPNWNLTLNGLLIPQDKHIRINDYANAWIINPKQMGISGVISGKLSLGFEKYFQIGFLVSFLSTAGVMIYCVIQFLKGKHER